MTSRAELDECDALVQRLDVCFGSQERLGQWRERELERGVQVEREARKTADELLPTARGEGGGTSICALPIGEVYRVARQSGLHGAELDRRVAAVALRCASP